MALINLSFLIDLVDEESESLAELTTLGGVSIGD
jgi:hypothetical protein